MYIDEYCIWDPYERDSQKNAPCISTIGDIHEIRFTPDRAEYWCKGTDLVYHSLYPPYGAYQVEVSAHYEGAEARIEYICADEEVILLTLIEVGWSKNFHYTIGSISFYITEILDLNSFISFWQIFVFRI